jgi:hypothetical protein
MSRVAELLRIAKEATTSGTSHPAYEGLREHAEFLTDVEDGISSDTGA